MKYFAFIVIGVVVVVLGVSLFFVGSPAEERERKFDVTRTNDLASIQSNIVEFYRVKKTVPTQLADLKDDVRNIQVPLDPKTKVSYEYVKKDDVSFTLCANFALESDDVQDGRYTQPMYYPYEKGPFMNGGDVWKHGPGRVCFDRMLDTDFFAPVGDVQNGSFPMK
jgi:hypothetical protein